MTLLNEPLVVHGRFPFKLFALMLLVRGLDLLLVQSTFVPDEYWQSLEVAHKEVFNYGRLTWEWTNGLRNYIYVTFIAGIYSLLKYLSWDEPLLLVLLPRIMQGVFSALADVYFIRWVHQRRNGQYAWALLSWLTAYFISYCSTRTLINTFDMNLTVIALYYYTWPGDVKSYKFLSLVSFLFFIRPTSLVVWTPLLLINLLAAKRPVMHLLKVYLPVVGLISALCIAVDSYFYDRLEITPFNFFQFNVLHRISDLYGVHDLAWYFYAGIPFTVGLQSIPLYYSFTQTLLDVKSLRMRITHDTDTQMFITVLWSVIIFSLMPHKEFRFLLPLSPMMIYLSSGVLRTWSVSAKTSHLYIVGSALIIANFVTLTFLGHFHQVGGPQTMVYLRSIAKNHTDSKFLFLMPCHSLPLYSHLHANISTRFLTCEPNLKQLPNYKDEADWFYEDPSGWLQREYSTIYTCTLPTHIISYNTLNIPNFLHNNNYTLQVKFFNSFIYPNRTGDYINVYRRKGPVC